MRYLGLNKPRGLSRSSCCLYVRGDAIVEFLHHLKSSSPAYRSNCVWTLWFQKCCKHSWQALSHLCGQKSRIFSVSLSNLDVCSAKEEQYPAPLERLSNKKISTKTRPRLYLSLYPLLISLNSMSKSLPAAKTIASATVCPALFIHNPEESTLIL